MVQELDKPKPECPRENDKISFSLEFIKTLTTVKLGFEQTPYTKNRQFVCKILPQLFPLVYKVIRLDVIEWCLVLEWKQEPASSGFSHACLKIRSRNEEAINSTRNETHLLAKCFLLPILSTSILFICFWIDLVRVLATTGNTSAVASYTRV